MATIALKWAEQGGTGNVAYPDCAGDIVQNRYEADLSQAPLKGVALPANTIIDFGIIPANTTVTDLMIDTDDLDTGAAALAYDVGIISGTPGDITGVRTVGTEFFSATNASQSQQILRMSKVTGFRIDPVPYDRSIGIKITTAAGTLATTGKLALVLDVKG